MDEETRGIWQALGDRLEAAGPDKLQDVIKRLTDVAEAQEIIAGFDHQLFLRPRRPTKRYLA